MWSDMSHHFSNMGRQINSDGRKPGERLFGIVMLRASLSIFLSKIFVITKYVEDYWLRQYFTIILFLVLYWGIV